MPVPLRANNTWACRGAPPAPWTYGCPEPDPSSAGKMVGSWGQDRPALATRIIGATRAQHGYPDPEEAGTEQ